MDQLARNWWAFALRGVLAILFGLGAFVFPGVTLAAVVMVFGAYVLVDGIFAVIAAVRSAERHQRWGMLLLEGALGIVAGLITFFWPGVTALTLVMLVAVWAIITGILEIVAAIRLRKEIQNEWLLGIAGVLSVLLGVLLIAQPGAGLIVWVWMMGAYALIFGIVLVALALRLRGLRPRFTHSATTS
jgi:uncharacterized membrane protein HdeD (DUF308 family)